MQQRKDKVVKTFTGGVRALMKTNKVTIFEGGRHHHRAWKSLGQILRWQDAGAGNEEHRYCDWQRHRLSCRLPKFDGKTIVTSTEALTFTEAPKKLLVVGGGRDRPRTWLGLEPTRLGSNHARISPAHCRRVRS